MGDDGVAVSKMLIIIILRRAATSKAWETTWGYHYDVRQYRGDITIAIQFVVVYIAYYALKVCTFR